MSMTSKARKFFFVLVTAFQFFLLLLQYNFKLPFFCELFIVLFELLKACFSKETADE